MGRVKQGAVIPPIAFAAELRQRHQFYGGDAHLRQTRQLFSHFAIAAQHPDMQLIDHCLMPGPALPLIVLPWVIVGVDDHAVTVEPAVLRARSRVRHLKLAIDAVAITSALRAGGIQ